MGNVTKITSSSGKLQFEGNARPWRDELGDLLLLQVQGAGSSANSTESTIGFTSGAALTDYLYTNLQLNHDRYLPGAIYPHLHWFQGSSATPNWLLQYRWQVNGGAKTTGWTAVRCITPVHAYVTGTIHQISQTSAPIAAPAGVALSDIVQFRILRDNANDSSQFTGADAYAGAAAALSFDVHFALDGIGFTSEYGKD